VNGLFAAVVSRLLGLPRFVARTALMAALFHGVFVGGVTVIKSGTNALFLSRADPSTLPLLYAVVAVVVGFSTAVLARLLGRRPLRQLFGQVIVFNAVILCVATALAMARVPGAPAFLYVWGEASATTGSVLFWSRLMDGFTSRDQKRVVGVVGGGGMIGASIGGLAMRLCVDVTGVPAPIFASAVLWVLALPLLRVLRTRSSAAGDEAPPRPAPHDGSPTKEARRTQLSTSDTRAAVFALFRQPYVRAVASLVVLCAATGAASDFVFRAAASRSSENEMAGLFGLLNAVVGIVVVVLQIGLTGRLLARLGVFVFAAIIPALLVLAVVVYVVVSIVDPQGPWGFRVLVVLKGVEMAGAYSLFPVVVALLYNPIAPELRAQSRALIDGAVKKVGAAVAGLVLGALASRADVVSVWTVLCTAVLTLVLLPTLRRLYSTALEERVQAPVARGRAFSIDTADKDTRRALEAGLQSSDSDDVLAALDALGPAYELEGERLLLLLEHPEERVRATALARVPSRPDDQLAERLLRIARTPGARRPRAEAVRALARVQPGKAADVVMEFLDDQEPGVVCAALEVALRSRHDLVAKARLKGLLTDVTALSVAWRRDLARLLGVLRDGRYAASISALMNDPDHTVRVLAIEAAARRGDPSHIDELIVRLGERSTRVAVVMALIRYRDAAVPALSAALDDTKLAVAVRARVPRLLERIGTDAAAHALLFSNPRDDAWLQRRIARSLVRVVDQNPEIVVDRRRCDEAIGRRLVAFAAYADALADLDASDDVRLRLLRHIVNDRRRQNLEIALDLLGLHRGIDRMRVVAQGILDRRKQARIDALELLDVALTADPLRTDFLSLLDVREVDRPAHVALQRAKHLTQSRDPLLRGIARHTLRRCGVDDDEVTRGGEGVRLPGSFELEGSDMADPLVERLFLLEDVDLFRGLAADDLLAIAALATELVVEPGLVLYREGDLGNDNLYVIIDGVIELTRGGKLLMTLNPGESAGQVSFVDKGPRPVTARVADGKAARLLVVEREQFFDLMADRTSLMNGFFDVLANRLRALIDKASPEQQSGAGRLSRADDASKSSRQDG
jgi:CRP-like cAMP-binding protein/HEAT repeat protein